MKLKISINIHSRRKEFLFWPILAHFDPFFIYTVKLNITLGMSSTAFMVRKYCLSYKRQSKR
jgi:hypothetical protein